MTRWMAGLAAALLIPACGGGNGSETSTAATPDGGNPAPAPASPAPPAAGQAPAIRIIRPDSGSTVPAGSKITIDAEVANPTADVARVEFYEDNQLIGSASSPPYTLTTGPLKEGTHDLCAVAIDPQGAPTPSVPVTLFVVRVNGEKKDQDRDH